MELTRGFALDEVKVEKGLEHPQGADASITLRYISSEAAKKAAENLPRQLRDMLNHPENYPAGKFKEFQTEILVNGLIVGWKGFDEHGKSIRFTEKTARRILGTYELLIDKWWKLSNEQDLYTAETFQAVEDDAKN